MDASDGLLAGWRVRACCVMVKVHSRPPPPVAPGLRRGRAALQRQLGARRARAPPRPTLQYPVCCVPSGGRPVTVGGSGSDALILCRYHKKALRSTLHSPGVSPLELSFSGFLRKFPLPTLFATLPCAKARTAAAGAAHPHACAAQPPHRLVEYGGLHLVP